MDVAREKVMFVLVGAFGPRPGLDGSGQTHGDDSLILAWPQAVPGHPCRALAFCSICFEQVLCITSPGLALENSSLLDRFME